MVTDASVCTSCRCRAAAQGFNGLRGWRSEPWRGSFSDRTLIAENQCADLFVSTVTLTLKPGSALQCGRRGSEERRVGRAVNPRGSKAFLKEIDPPQNLAPSSDEILGIERQMIPEKC